MTYSWSRLVAVVTILAFSPVLNHNLKPERTGIPSVCSCNFKDAIIKTLYGTFIQGLQFNVLHNKRKGETLLLIVTVKVV